MQKAGKSGRTRGLVDMGIQLPPFEYQRPVGAQLEYDAPIQLTPQHRLHVRTWMYNGRVVDFALCHWWEDPGGVEHEMVRYDCCHSVVHKHQFHRQGEETWTSIKAIDRRETSWNDVDQAYAACYEEFFDKFEEHHRRWMT